MLKEFNSRVYRDRYTIQNSVICIKMDATASDSGYNVIASTDPHPHFLSFSQTELLLTTQCNFQFAESFLVPGKKGQHDLCTGRVLHCFWWTEVTELPTLNNWRQSEHLAALYDLNFQLFGGPELRHRPQTGSGEPVGCQLNPTPRFKTQPQPLAFKPLKFLNTKIQT